LFPDLFACAERVGFWRGGDRARRCIQPNEGFLYQLRKYYGEFKKKAKKQQAEGEDVGDEV
jgi:hypothetical protein